MTNPRPFILSANVILFNPESNESATLNLSFGVGEYPPVEVFEKALEEGLAEARQGFRLAEVEDLAYMAANELLEVAEEFDIGARIGRELND